MIILGTEQAEHVPQMVGFFASKHNMPRQIEATSNFVCCWYMSGL